MDKKYPFALTTKERAEQHQSIAAGTAPVRKLTHAQGVLKANQGPEGPALADERSTEAVEAVSYQTVRRTLRHLCCARQKTSN